MTKQRTHLTAAEARILQAQAILDAANIPLGQDFYILDASQVEALLVEADRLKYRKPKNANGSRGRYFYAYLVRLARRANGHEFDPDTGDCQVAHCYKNVGTRHLPCQPGPKAG